VREQITSRSEAI